VILEVFLGGMASAPGWCFDRDLYLNKGPWNIGLYELMNTRNLILSLGI